MQHLLNIRSLIFAATLCARAVAAHHAMDEARLVIPSNAYLAIGMHRDEVLAQLGAPAEKLSADIWVYWDFRAKSRPAGEKTDTLIVVLSSNRVSRIRITERQPVMALLAHLQRKAAEKSAVAAR